MKTNTWVWTRPGLPIVEVHMDRTPSPDDPSAYLENLMHAGQDAMKQFDDALASATGVRRRNPTHRGASLFPFALIADLQREYFKQIWRFGTRFLADIFRREAHADVALAGRQALQGRSGRSCLTTIFSSNHTCWAQGSCTNSWTERRSTTRRDCSFGFMPVSSSTR